MIIREREIIIEKNLMNIVEMRKKKKNDLFQRDINKLKELAENKDVNTMKKKME